MTKKRLASLLAASAVVGSATSAQRVAPPDAAAIDKMAARFAPVNLRVDLVTLSENERQALGKILDAARLMDSLFLRQVWAGNESLLMELLRQNTPLGRAQLHYFLINKGPWSRIDHNRPFIEGVPSKPESASFYPADATKSEVEAWLDTLPEADRRRATGFFTTIRRGSDARHSAAQSPRGGDPAAARFVIVPYSLEYQGELALTADLLRQAAALTKQPTLKTYLTTRAEAFLSNDYYASDVAWMELDASIELTIGPYEVYEDEWFNYKAAFEAFITLRDDVETQKLTRFSAELQDIENHLPIEPRHRNPQLGALAPIRVVNEIFAAGDANRGVQTAAFNLPNDERVIREKGSKRVMLKNVQEAKFNLVLLPISKIALPSAVQGDVAFEAFFTHILMHELMHGLGPHDISLNGRMTTVRQELKETYSAIEEAKADISGLFALQYLVDKGVLDKKFELTMYTTFLASAFRSIRFGINEAHGKGVAVQLNYLIDYGAVTIARDGTFRIVPGKVREAVSSLTREIMTLQAEGSHAKARDLLQRLGVVRPEVQTVLDRLETVPVDIEPKFVTAEELAESRK